jgi:predicted transcriptional regulator
MNQAMSIELPAPVFHRLQRVAETTHRSVQDVLVTTINVALPVEADLPTELADELAAMIMFSDEALWTSTQSSLSPAQQVRLNQLADAGDTRTLNKAEAEELAQLLELYDRAVLRRARALSILAYRGHELPDQTNLAA